MEMHVPDKISSKVAQRLCLGWCNKTFVSKSPGDRYCQKCKVKKSNTEKHCSLKSVKSPVYTKEDFE